MKVLPSRLSPGDAIDLAYPYGLTFVRETRWTGRLSDPVEVDYGIREDDVQGTLYFDCSESVEVIRHG